LINSFDERINQKNSKNNSNDKQKVNDDICKDNRDIKQNSPRSHKKDNKNNCYPVVPKERRKEWKRNISSNNNAFENSNIGVLILDIIDTGIGIKESDLKLLFQPFHQVQTANKHQGSGLGLWITKQLVNSMNGILKVHSEYEKGTTFRVSIPLKIKLNLSLDYEENKINSPLISFDQRRLLFPPNESGFIRISDNKKASYILITYKEENEKNIINDLFYNERSSYKFNKKYITNDFVEGLQTIKSKNEIINSIILFSISNVSSSLEFIVKIRNIEREIKIPKIPILLVGQDPKTFNLNDFRKYGVKNFCFDIFSIKNISKQFKKMIKQEML